MLPVVQIDQLLNSEVFKGELESMSGAFYTILFKWLNIAFEVYDDKSKEREREFVKDLAMNVLNHEELVHVIWQQIDRGDTPMLFEQILKNPHQDWKSFFSLAVRLCGKSSYRNRYAERMFSYLCNTKIKRDN